MSERTIVFLVGAVQFINILDFMMVMPLGPDFARSLAIPSSHLGFIGGSYTAAAAVSGVLGAFFLDRFDRRKALAVAMAGLVLGTIAGAFARGLWTLLAARVVAGLFGGPATSVSYSIIADVIPAERRGRAMGAVMGAFSIASIAGVPAGLELAAHGGWRTPFLAVGAAGLLVTVAAVVLLPSMRAHIDRAASAPAHREPPLWDLFVRPLPRLAYAMTALVMVANFILIPNISAYVQFNLHYPRERLGLLYLAGGSVSFVAMRLVGALVDRYGSFRLGTVGTFLGILVVYAGFFNAPPLLPVIAIFVGFMLGAAFRNVSLQTISSRVPLPDERARYMSLQSAVSHMASAAGAFASAQMLRELPGGQLEGMPRLAVVSMALSALMPVLLFAVEARVVRRARESAKAQASVGGAAPAVAEANPPGVH